jgi:uncharacterized protein (TIGR02270 family)
VKSRTILDQHAEEASFLWLQRRRAVGAPHYSLKQLAELDTRLEAHLDGLRVSGEEGEAACKEVLPMETPGDIFVLASAAFNSGKPDRIAGALSVAASDPRFAGAAASGLAWLPADRAREQAGKLFASADPLHRRVAVGASALLRHDPGAPLVAATRDADPGVLGRAIRALGELGRVDLSVLAATRMSHGAAAVRFAGAWAAARLGKYPNAVVALQKIAETEPGRAVRAADLALRRMDPKSGAAWLAKLPPRLAVIGAGVVGDPALVPGLLDRMKDPKLARVAGEAIEMITGVDIDGENLHAPPPEGFEAGPTESPEDDDVAMDPDGDLPWPDLEKVGQWWKSHQGRFAPGKRYLVGLEIGVEACRKILRSGRQRQRAAAALELALLEPDKPLFEVRAPGYRQLRAL